MATNTYVALDKATVTVATPSITFTGISGIYTDLIIVYNGSITTASDVSLTLQFNGDTSTNSYSNTFLQGNGSTTSSFRETNQPTITCGYTQQTLSTTIIQIMNYANTTTYKTVITKGGSTAGAYRTTIGSWRKTPEAITSIVIANNGAVNFSVGTTFSLYGVKASTNSESTPKATGGYVYSDDTYYYHAFQYSGTFTPTATLSCDILTIAGGGSGSGIYVGGGGGAGGVVYNPSASLSATGYTVTIGAGGAALATGVDGGNAGSNTTFGALTTAYGGGRGGYYNGVAGQSGGSGGGGGNTTSVGSATQGTSSITFTAYGNSGGAGSTNASGGGGGAGAAGSAQTSGLYGGLGGLGLNTWASWMTATNFGINGYVANGGSGANQNGYGAASGNATGGAAQGQNGYPATGGGGGGTREAGTKGSGGSGLVIVRYAKA